MSLFICFTGIDGSGKSTLARAVVDSMNKKGIKANYVYNRYKPLFLKPIMILGELIFLHGKSFYKNYSEYSDTKKSATKKHSFLAGMYQYLLLKDYQLQIFFKIKLPLVLGNNIVCDRYIYDTIVTDLAVDFEYSNEDIDNSLAKIISQFPKPNFVFLIDVPEEISFSRKSDIPSIEYLVDRRKIFKYIGTKCKFQLLNGLKETDELRMDVEKVVFQ